MKTPGFTGLFVGDLGGGFKYCLTEVVSNDFREGWRLQES